MALRYRAHARKDEPDATSRSPAPSTPLESPIAHLATLTAMPQPLEQADECEQVVASAIQAAVTSAITISSEDYYLDLIEAAVGAAVGGQAWRQALMARASGDLGAQRPRALQVIVPPALRKNVLNALHDAHQGVTSMYNRANAFVYWPGIKEDITDTRARCGHCNEIAPSNPQLPVVNSEPPATPFEAIAADYFDFRGVHYLVTVDRLSGWINITHATSGTPMSGAKGLYACLRLLFADREMLSDCRPEFKSTETTAFLENWGVIHRLSSAYFPQSNGRAEVAVKTAKRLLMDNTLPNGSLDTDKFLKALLIYRNTPDPATQMSPAQLRDVPVVSLPSRQNEQLPEVVAANPPPTHAPDVRQGVTTPPQPVGSENCPAAPAGPQLLSTPQLRPSQQRHPDAPTTPLAAPGEDATQDKAGANTAVTSPRHSGRTCAPPRRYVPETGESAAFIAYGCAFVARRHPTGGMEKTRAK